MAKEEKAPIIIVKRRKRAGGGHHGGAWKVAYADFVTAMMAFFLVMWLVTAVSKDQRAALFDYFKNPSMQPGKSLRPAPAQMGPGGASTSAINLGGGMDAPRTSMVKTVDQVSKSEPFNVDPAAADMSPAAAREIADAADHKKLESLMVELRQAIDKSQALKPFKDQLLLDITPEGLRVQIVDAQNRPMFDVGSSRLKDYTTVILQQLAGYLNSVPNHISLSGHTDVRPYPGGGDYSNWELSTDRANAARRALEAGGLAPDKVSRVVGLSSTVLFDSANPENPINRRISIIVMTKAAEDSAHKKDAQPEMAPGALTTGPALSTETPAVSDVPAAPHPVPPAAPAVPAGAAPIPVAAMPAT